VEEQQDKQGPPSTDAERNIGDAKNIHFFHSPVKKQTLPAAKSNRSADFSCEGELAVKLEDRELINLHLEVLEKWDKYPRIIWLANKPWSAHAKFLAWLTRTPLGRLGNWA
jgi:hypothetical protein